jgi:hypothetical protein
MKLGGAHDLKLAGRALRIDAGGTNPYVRSTALSESFRFLERRRLLVAERHSLINRR